MTTASAARAADVEHAAQVARRVVSASNAAETAVANATGTKGLKNRIPRSGASLRQVSQELDTAVLQAAVELVDALDALVKDTRLWRRMARADADVSKLGTADRHLLRELAVHDLGVLLEQLHYEEPPTIDSWAHGLQSTVDLILSDEEVDLQQLARQAEHELRRLVCQLRPLVKREVSRSSRWRREIHGLLRESRVKAVPAAVGVLASSGVLLATGDGGASAGALALAKLAEVTVQVWSTRAVASRTEPAPDLSESVLLVLDATDVWLAQPADDAWARDRALFQVRRSVFALLQASRPRTTTGEARLWEAARSVLDACEAGTFDDVARRGLAEALRAAL